MRWPALRVITASGALRLLPLIHSWRLGAMYPMLEKQLGQFATRSQPSTNALSTSVKAEETAVCVVANFKALAKYFE